MSRQAPASQGQVFCPRCGRISVWAGNVCPYCGPRTQGGAGQPAVAATVAAPLPVEYIGFWFRVLALLIDAALATGAEILLQLIGVPGIGVSIFGLVSVLHLCFTGQTLGKRVVGIQIVNAMGSPPGLWRGLVRQFPGMFLATLALGLGLLWVAWDQRKQGWHDHLAGTFVVRKDRYHRRTAPAP